MNKLNLEGGIYVSMLMYALVWNALCVGAMQCPVHIL